SPARTGVNYFVAMRRRAARARTWGRDSVASSLGGTSFSTALRPRPSRSSGPCTPLATWPASCGKNPPTDALTSAATSARTAKLGLHPRPIEVDAGRAGRAVALLWPLRLVRVRQVNGGTAAQACGDGLEEGAGPDRVEPVAAEHDQGGSPRPGRFQPGPRPLG